MMKLGDFEVERLADDLQKAHREIDSLSSEVKRLRGAIEKHRDFNEKHDLTPKNIKKYLGNNDEKLYKALEGGREE